MPKFVMVAVSVAMILYVAWRIYKNWKAKDGFVMELLFMFWLVISTVGNAVLPGGKFLPFYIQLIIYAIIAGLATRPPKKDVDENQA